MSKTTPKTRWTQRLKHGIGVLTLVGGAAGIVPTSTAAAAEPAPSPLEAVRAVSDQRHLPSRAGTSIDGGLESRGDDGSTARIPTTTQGRLELRSPTGELILGVTPPRGGGSLTTTPRDDGRVVREGPSPSVSTVMQLNDRPQASASIFQVLRDSAAPTEYRYRLTVPDRIALRQGKSGAIELIDPSSTAPGDDPAIGVIDAPWAMDAAGRSLPASYRLEGHDLIMSVDHRGATYPVVADPDVTTNCGIATCSIYWSRERSAAINAWVLYMTPGLALANFGCPYAPAGADRGSCFVVAYGSYGGSISPISQIALGIILNDAATNWKCFKITRTRGAGVPTYVSTNNGTYCKSY